MKPSSWKALALLAAAAASGLAAAGFALRKPPGAYVAVLSDPRAQKPMLYLNVSRADSEVRVKALDPLFSGADSSLELWALPRGRKPRSLGVIAPEKGVLELAATGDQALADVPILAVSLEPKGGSTTGAPTGPVLYSGPCVKDW